MFIDDESPADAATIESLHQRVNSMRLAVLRCESDANTGTSDLEKELYYWCGDADISQVIEWRDKRIAAIEKA